MSKEQDAEVDQNDNCFSPMDDSFVGYGEDESTPTAASLSLRKPSRKESQISLSGATYENGDLGVLHKVVDKFLNNTGLRPGVEVPDKETIVNALQTVLQNVNKDDDLWEWLEETNQFNTAEMLFVPNSLETNSNRGSFESSSSLGLLSYSDLSSFSLNSQENAKESDEQLIKSGHKAECDPVELFCQIEELQHQNRKLSEDNVRLQRQVTQTEDTNSQLFHEKELLAKSHLSLQVQAERKRELEQESTVLKVALASLEDLNARLQAKIFTYEKEKIALETRIQDLHDELCGNQTEIDNWHVRIGDLTEALLESKVNHDICCQNLKQKIAELEEKEHMVQELLTSNQVLKDKKTELEIQLCKAEQDIACLQHAARQVKCLSANLTDPEVDLNASCEASVLLEDCSVAGLSSCTPKKEDKCQHPTLAPTLSWPTSEPSDVDPAMCSTPQKSLLIRKMSLCAEMRNVVRSEGGDLPSPFCGKHIFPQALYEEATASENHNHSDIEPVMGDLEIGACIKTHPKRDLFSEQSSECQEKDPFSERILCQAEDLSRKPNVEIKSEGQNDDLTQLLADACRDLKQVNIDIRKINNDAVSILTPFPGLPGCVISEPEAINNNMVSDDKDPLNMELRLLRSHIANTQAILTYLSKNQKGAPGLYVQSVLQDMENSCNKNMSKSGLRDAATLLHHLSSDMLQNPLGGKSHSRSFWTSKDHNKGGSSTSPSQRSTPLHRSRWLTRSCPNIPSIPQTLQLQPSTHRATQTDYSPRVTSRLHSAEAPDAYRCSPSAQPRHRSSSFVAAICHGEGSGHERSNSGVTVQVQPNREVLILKDGLQESVQCTIHAYQDKEDEGYREKDFEDVYQEFRELQYGEEERSWEKEPLRRSQSEEVPEIQEAAKKRRRSFSEHNSHYSQAIDLEEEQEAEDEEEEEEEEPIFEDPEAMACRLEASHQGSQQPFRPAPGVLGSHVVGMVTGTPMPNPMLGLTAKLQQTSSPQALLMGQRPEKGLCKRRGGGGDGKGRFLMPDVMENSETESAKDSANGSMESEGPPPPPGNPLAPGEQQAESFVHPPPPGSDPTFPSLPDAFLRKIGLEKTSTVNPEDLTGNEVECKFRTLSLAFKTDKFTLEKRLELQQRQRDTAEKNIDSEVSSMRDELNTLNQLCSDSQMRDLITKLQHRLDIVQQSTSRMSSRAEVFGAVQQEFRARVNSAVGSLVNCASAGRLERLLISGGPAVPTAVMTAGPTMGVFNFPYMGPNGGTPLAGTSPVGTHLPLSPRNSSEGIAESAREECGISEVEEVTSGVLETASLDRVQAGYLAEMEDYLSEDKKRSVESDCSLQGDEPLSARLSTSSSISSSSHHRESSWSASPGKGVVKPSFIKQILSNRLLRKSYSMLLMWLPDDGWWTQWDVSSTTRALRYGLGSLLFLAALFSLLVTFLPAQDAPFCSSSSSSGPSRRSIQEILEIFFSPYVTRRQSNTLL